jgi:hypothetical protein
MIVPLCPAVRKWWSTNRGLQIVVHTSKSTNPGPQVLTTWNLEGSKPETQNLEWARGTIEFWPMLADFVSNLAPGGNLDFRGVFSQSSDIEPRGSTTCNLNPRCQTMKPATYHPLSIGGGDRMNRLDSSRLTVFDLGKFILNCPPFLCPN